MIRTLALLAVLATACRDSNKSAARDERIRDHRSAPAPAPADAATAVVEVDAGPTQDDLDRETARARLQKQIDDEAHGPAREERIEAAREAQKRAKAEAAKQLKAVRPELVQATKQLAKLDAELAKLVARAGTATTDAQRVDAQRQVDERRATRSGLAQKVEELREKVKRLECAAGINIPKECIENPLAKGCC